MTMAPVCSTRKRHLLITMCHGTPQLMSPNTFGAHSPVALFVLTSRV